MMITMNNNKNARPRGRPRSFDRQQALQTALELFWRQGYEGTSINDLINAIGIAPPSLYSAFGSKERLYQEAITLYLQGPGSFLQQALEQSSDTRDFVHHMLRAAADEFTALTHPPGCLVSTGLVASAERPLAQHLQELRAATLNIIRERLEQGVHAGELPVDCDCAALARFYGAMIQGMSIQAHDGALPAELHAMIQLAMTYWPATPAPAKCAEIR